MSPFYTLMSDELKIPLDKDLLARMQQANQEELTKLDERIKDAEQNLGETEVNEGLLAKAEYLAKIGQKVNGRRFTFVMPCRGA